MYKKLTAMILAAVTALGMAACNNDDSSSKAKTKSSPFGKIMNIDEESSVSGQDSSSSEKSIIETGAYARVGNNGAAAVYEVYMYSPDEPLDGKVTFRDLYGVHVLHTGVVGLVGAPIEVDYDSDEVKGGTLLFGVLKSELNGVRPDALMFMWYDEENQNYVELEQDTHMDELDDSLALYLPIDKPGVYLLVNKYAWLNAWGAGLDDNGLEEGYVQKPVENPFDVNENEGLSNEARWKKDVYTGDIIELADMDYMNSCIKDSSAEFNVSTVQQLAAACYYVNCCDDDKCSGITINLMADIDLSGVDWAPMGWDSQDTDNRFQGVFNGNGHTISNLKVDVGGFAGFFGGTLYCTVKDLNIVNADIKGGRNAAVLSPQDVRSLFSDIYVSGVTTSNEAGTMLGDEAAATVFNCKQEVLANGSDLDGELSFTSYNKKLITDKFGRPEKIYLDGDYVVRASGIENKYSNMQWYVEVDGNRVYEGDNSERLSIDKVLANIAVNNTLPQGKYVVSLNAFVDGEYIRISNDLEIDIYKYAE